MATEGEPSRQRTTVPGARVWSGILAALAAGAVGAASSWGLLRWEQLHLIRHIAEVTGIETGFWLAPHDAIPFGLRLAGLALLSWLLARRPDAPVWRSLAQTAGTLIAWLAVAWALFPAIPSVWWPGPIPPVLLDHMDVAHRAAPVEAFLWPFLAVVTLVASVWVGARDNRPPHESTTPGLPSRRASRAASGAVGTVTLAGLVGIAVLVATDSAIGTGGSIDLTSLTDRLVLLAAAAAGVAWLVSGTAHAPAVLVLVATIAVLAGELATDSPYRTGAVLLGIATAWVASARRPLADALDRLTL